MYQPRKYYKRGSMSKSFSYVKPRYACEVCKITCTSYKQLEQHQQGIKHKMQKKSFWTSEEAEENSFSLDHMVVLDQTEDDLPNDNAASPASCDSSDTETAASASAIDNIPSSQMVILDETNDDHDHPASPASCDSSASEFAASSTDVTLKKKPRTEMPDDDQTAPVSPLSSCLSSKSSTGKGAIHSSSEKSTGKERHVKSRMTRHKESKKTFHVTPVKSNQDVFRFLKTFAVANESDEAFAKKVKEMFSNALRKYKESELEKIFCTEAEHSSSEDLVASDCPSDHEETNSSILQATSQSECQRINSAPGSPANSSSPQCISNSTSSVYCESDLPVIKQSNYPDTSPVASLSPTSKCEGIDTSSKPSATNSTYYNPYSPTETDVLMESENCITAEAACSDDEDV